MKLNANHTIHVANAERYLMCNNNLFLKTKSMCLIIVVILESLAGPQITHDIHICVSYLCLPTNCQKLKKVVIRMVWF